MKKVANKIFAVLAEEKKLKEKTLQPWFF